MTIDTTSPSYWLNWRFFLCAIWILSAMVVAVILILKYEGFIKVKKQRRDNQRETGGSLYKDDAWRTCLKAIHPAWLLAYRLIAFSVLLALIITNLVMDGGGIFYFYTQWTFALVTICFGFGSLISIYGCRQSPNEGGGDMVVRMGLDKERGTYMPPTHEEIANPHSSLINLNTNGEPNVHKMAGLWGYAFQIIFQMCAGAVMLTDSVFWLIIYPFLTDKDYRLNFMDVSLHSVNAIFLLGDIILNRLRFPFFRLAYFVLWTCIFVIFQWIVHAVVSMWWPYPFLDLSSSYAPLWYLGVGLLHLPCYGIVTLVVRTKQFCLSRFTKALVVA